MCFLNLSIHILKYLRFSATNTARLYDLTLSENLTYLDGWSLGSQLTTKHIWDGFNIVDDHQTQGTFFMYLTQALRVITSKLQWRKEINRLLWKGSLMLSTIPAKNACAFMKWRMGNSVRLYS